MIKVDAYNLVKDMSMEELSEICYAIGKKIYLEEVKVTESDKSRIHDMERVVGLMKGAENLLFTYRSRDD